MPPLQGSFSVSGRDFICQSNILFRDPHGSTPESHSPVGTHPMMGCLLLFQEAKPIFPEFGVLKKNVWMLSPKLASLSPPALAEILEPPRSLSLRPEIPRIFAGQLPPCTADSDSTSRVPWFFNPSSFSAISSHALICQAWVCWTHSVLPALFSVCCPLA